MIKTFVLSTILGLVMAVMMAAYQPVGQSVDDAMLKPGDEIDGMILTTGATDAPPLWAFCSYIEKNQYTMKTDCRIPPMLSEIAIGQFFDILHEVPSQRNWSEFTWKLAVDEQPIDLARFGTYNLVLPTLSASPVPVREVMKTFTTWDVVLTNLKPGKHTLHGFAQSETNSHTWTVNVLIEGPYASDFEAMP